MGTVFSDAVAVADAEAIVSAAVDAGVAAVAGDVRSDSAADLPDRGPNGVSSLS